MKAQGFCLFLLAAALLGQIPSLQAGPCTEDLAVLDEALRPPPPSKTKRPRSGQASASLPEARYDPLLAQAKKLDAENNPDCRRLIDEILLIIGM
jgi:hypothetical protein